METYIKLQNVLLPRVDICTETSLFYHSSQECLPDVDEAAGQLLFRRGHTICDFSSYFNACSYAKWNKYTQIGQVRLCLVLKGSFEVRLLAHAECPGAEGGVDSLVLSRQTVQGDGTAPMYFPFVFSDTPALLGFSLCPLTENAVFCGGWYEAAVAAVALREVDLAADICTFKREPYLLRNLKILERDILSNPNSELQGHFQVFISDNGQTLPLAELNTDKIHVVYNKNVGGAGGFTRGLLEILKARDRCQVTHVIMMDDDIVIEAEALLRTYNLLRCRRPEYEDLFVGGAMLRLDRPQIQNESGALWNMGHIRPLRHGVDLSLLENCLRNEEEIAAEYNGWWYCCTPVQFIREDNLPYPFFIRCDDIEYCMRNIRDLALLNGVCVWHEAFDAKYSSFLYYYELRNMLYTNMLRYPAYSKTAFLQLFYRYAFTNLLRYRYRDVRLAVRGVRDFYKGPGFLLHTDGEQLHKEIMDLGYKAVPMEELPCSADPEDYARSLSETESRVHKLLRRLSFNGFLLPVRRRTVKCIPMAAPRPLNCYRCKTILNYDERADKGFLTEKSYAELFRCLGQILAVTFQTFFRFEAARKDVRANEHMLRSADFWNRYLGL